MNNLWSEADNRNADAIAAAGFDVLLDSYWVVREGSLCLVKRADLTLDECEHIIDWCARPAN